MRKETGGDAFPGSERDQAGREYPYKGMTLRDYFAAKALPVLPVMSSYNMLPKETLEHFQARNAYLLADAMMEARK